MVFLSIAGALLVTFIWLLISWNHPKNVRERQLSRSYPRSMPPMTRMPPTARETESMPGVRTPPLTGTSLHEKYVTYHQGLIDDYFRSNTPPEAPETGVQLDPNWEWEFVPGADGQPDRYIKGRCKHLPGKVIPVVAQDGTIPAQLCTNCGTQFDVPIPTE